MSDTSWKEKVKRGFDLINEAVGECGNDCSVDELTERVGEIAAGLAIMSVFVDDVANGEESPNAERRLEDWFSGE